MIITDEIKSFLEDTFTSNGALVHPGGGARIVLDPGDDHSGAVFVTKDVIAKLGLALNKTFVVALGRNKDWYKLCFIEDMVASDMVSLDAETIDKFTEREASVVKPEPEYVKLMESEGVKDDTAKPSLGLIPYSALAAIAAAFDYGAKKYATYNFTKGIKLMRLVSAAGRHIWQYTWVEKHDPETGLSHLAHAGACICMALWMDEHRPDLDDTYRNQKST